MKAENAIEVHNITKKFRVYMDKGFTLKELALFKKRRKYEARVVLDDISFEVKKGEALGLIGHNGCGKSTTLKLLTRIMYPDSGSIEMKGRVSSLIELGAGFHPDMSGRQNIYTNASIFGLTRKEIEERIDDIIAFSELEEFIDNPVRTYSSGMYMRLAFAVAINVDAEILLIDEILAVGDANFQAKCFDKLKQIKSEGTTIVIVSHSLGQIEEICERSIWIHGGKIQQEGAPRDVHPMYLEFMGQKRADNKAASEDGEQAIKVDENIHMKSMVMKDQEGQEIRRFKTGESVNILFGYEVEKNLEKVHVEFDVFNSNGVCCYEGGTLLDRMEGLSLEGKGEIALAWKQVMLLPGHYTVDLKLKLDSKTLLGFYKALGEFEVYSEFADKGICRIEHEWQSA